MATQLTGPVLAVAQGFNDESSTQYHNLGELVYSNDGRAFRYAKAGASDLASGKLNQASAEDTTNLQNLSIAAASAGASAVVTTSTVTLSANQAGGGLLVITGGPSRGQIYKIKDHAAASAAVVTLNLEDSLKAALTTSSTIDVIPNPFNGVVVNPTTATSAAIGVTVGTITAAYYGWLQVRGPAPVLADGAITVGYDVAASNGTAGAVEPMVTGVPGTQSRVGVALTGIATTEYGLINLQLA